MAAQPQLEASDRLLIHAALMSFATAVHRERLDYVDAVLCSCAEALGAAGGAEAAPAEAAAAGAAAAGAAGAAAGAEADEEGAGAEAAAAAAAPVAAVAPGPPMIISDQKGVRQLVALLTVPLDTYDVVAVRGRSSYPRVMVGRCRLTLSNPS